MAAFESLLLRDGDHPRGNLCGRFRFPGAGGSGLRPTGANLGQPYALAFIDVRMPPGWDGLETISHLWQADPDLQIVICTAYSDYDWKDIEQRLGVSHNFVILKNLSITVKSDSSLMQ